MTKNDTINVQLNHRSIRAFKDQTLTQEQLTTLYDVARHTSSSRFLQQFSILHLTDEKKRAAVREIADQPYVGANGDLFIFIADLYRNQQLRHDLGQDDGNLHTFDEYAQAVEDTVLAVQKVVIAAESMGLGAVILGSIKNDPVKLIKALELPKMTFPILGVQIGVPDQQPQLKPRLPIAQVAFENNYPKQFKAADLKDYDDVVTTYYDLRDANRRIDSFTKQVAGGKLSAPDHHRDEIAQAIHDQGLALDMK